MARQGEPIPDAELDVLKVLWGSESLTARAITEAVYGEPTPSNIATVQKLIQRLEKRGCVDRDRSQYVHRFSARVTQQEVAGRHLELLAEKVSNGSLAPFITHLARARLSRKERDAIRRLLED